MNRKLREIYPMKSREKWNPAVGEPGEFFSYSWGKQLSSTLQPRDGPY